MLKLKQKNWIKNRINPFRYTFSDFVELPEKEKDRLLEIADKVNLAFVNEYFLEHPDIDWFIIAKEPCNVIDSGRSNDEPFEDDLMELAKKLDAIVFTYSRDKIIEEELSLFPEYPIIAAADSSFDQVALIRG